MPGAATVMDMHALKLVNPIGTQEMLEYVPGINAFADDGIGNLNKYWYKGFKS